MACRALTIAALVLLASAAAGAAEGPWSRFRGPNGSGLADAPNLPVTWTDKDYNWKVRLPGSGHSSPVVWGNRIYVTCADAETARRTLLCLDTADGRTVWRRDDPSKPYGMHGDNSFASATPAADADGVVVTWTTPDRIVLLALDPDGREVWRTDLGPIISAHGSGVSPIFFGDLVVLANDQENMNFMPGGDPKSRERPIGKSSLIAVDRKTGRTRWQTERRSGYAAFSTPCVYQPEGGPPELIVTSTAHGITSVDPATGTVNWEVPDIFLDRCVGSPVTAPGLVIAGYGTGTRGTLYVAVRPGSRQKGEKPTIAYSIQKTVPLVPTPIVKDGRLFFWYDDGMAACLNVATGEVLWRERVGGPCYGSPVCVGNRLYGITRGGEVIVVAASDKFEVLGRVPLGELSYATPAVADGVMYLRTHTQLFSLGARKP